jgi:hypothetical protein
MGVVLLSQLDAGSGRLRGMLVLFVAWPGK